MSIGALTGAGWRVAGRSTRHRLARGFFGLYAHSAVSMSPSIARRDISWIGSSILNAAVLISRSTCVGRAGKSGSVWGCRSCGSRPRTSTSVVGSPGPKPPRLLTVTPASPQGHLYQSSPRTPVRLSRAICATRSSSAAAVRDILCAVSCTQAQERAPADFQLLSVTRDGATTQICSPPAGSPAARPLLALRDLTARLRSGGYALFTRSDRR